MSSADQNNILPILFLQHVYFTEHAKVWNTLYYTKSDLLAFPINLKE